MKFFRNIFLIIGLGLFGFIGWLIFYLGLLLPVEIFEMEQGPFILLFQEHRGAYHKIVGVIEKVEAWAIEHHLDCHVTFGEYIDNPEVQEEERLQSYGGCMLPSQPNIPLPNEFKVREVPRRHYVVAHFRGSPGVGPFKVYPKVQDYFAEKNHPNKGPVIEMYEILNREKNQMITTYLFPW